MLCEKCNSREANVLIREIVNGVSTERHLCTECAQENGLGLFFDGESAFMKLLSGILAKTIRLAPKEGEEEKEINVTCPVCHMSYGNFVKYGQFGCPECYETFGLLIHDSIKKLHGSDSHVGKFPGNAVKIRMKNTAGPEAPGDLKETDKERLQILLARQKEAIEDEDYEEAALLRDQIRELKAHMEA